MTIADVPVTELAGLRCRGQDLIPSRDLSAHGSPTALLLVDKFGVVCQDQGQVGLSGFVHVAIIGLVGTDRGSRWTPVTLSQTEEEDHVGDGVSGAVLLDLARGRATATGCHECWGVSFAIVPWASTHYTFPPIMSFSMSSS